VDAFFSFAASRALSSIGFFFFGICHLSPFAIWTTFAGKVFHKEHGVFVSQAAVSDAILRIHTGP
jgi:hypothetical protein